MNFDFARQINPALEKLDFVKALDVAETALKKVPESEYHFILGRGLSNQAEDLAIWVDEFYERASESIQVEALYFEMNEFDINTDDWYIDGFAYEQDGGLDRKDMEWLVDYATDAQTETGGIFIIEGYERLQKAFEKEPDSAELEEARDWCEQIILVRFMELMRSAHLRAKEKDMEWADVPVYFTEHSYDFIVRSVVG